ncbi:carbon-nitrogen hydrolase family protein [Bacillus sp. 31A1R]|uniref:Carbon-nitrogen hydrolase family protein n=1 Tax=Robertmurraya mangrovi TaxID=3098077 RepID=A0ABU5IWM8_9BACI|nr:carbon-nitrogen hydrolase family protein [Bacillus sp. 31A1R]MDZ5471557.1 carbon-nitrogen hydrolase family protein [Bacillus sp. 31A1R]
MKIGLAQTKFPETSIESLQRVKEKIIKAKEKECEIVCFPESIVPGLRGVGYEVEPYDHSFQERAIQEICQLARELQIAVILPMEWKDQLGLHMVAFVIDQSGQVLGYQTKNQIDPSEDFFGYVPGEGRQLFEINGVKFGIVICHEGWRYPETVRWAALKGASIVFHPQFTDRVSNPEFFNHAMVCRSVENNIYFASVNYAIEGQESTTSLISPTGERLITAEPNIADVWVHDIDPKQATRLLANRFHPHLL